MQGKRLVILGKFDGADIGALFAKPKAGEKDPFTGAQDWAVKNGLKVEIWFTTGEYDLMVQLDIPDGKDKGDELAHGFILALNKALGVRTTALTVVAHFLDSIDQTRDGIKSFGHTKMGAGGGG